jgi:hypothetical protein
MRIVKKREPNLFQGKQDRICSASIYPTPWNANSKEKGSKRVSGKTGQDMFCVYIRHEMRIVKKREPNLFQGKQDRTCSASIYTMECE